jgi:nitroimidazol reductase NimA-like FMN-containing flavoprotein (pyridoxamine 5'-phosphate oxidase superfamily)
MDPRNVLGCVATPRRDGYEQEGIHSILDRALVGNVAFVDHGQPVCIPMLYARIEDKLYIHGSRASRMMRLLSTGAPACFTMTVLDGIVLARSAFEHSANYESVVAFGRFEEVFGKEERLTALAAFTDKLLPGRWSEVRPPSERELKATRVLAMPLAEASAKVRSGPPDDDDSDDAELDVWAGELPITQSFHVPIASPGLRDGVPIPESVRRLLVP